MVLSKKDLLLSKKYVILYLPFQWRVSLALATPLMMGNGVFMERMITCPIEHTR